MILTPKIPTLTKSIDGEEIVITLHPTYTAAIVRSEGCFLGDGKEQVFVEWKDLDLELDKAVEIRIIKCRVQGMWYYDKVGTTFLAEPVGKGFTVAYNDYLTENKELINFTDAAQINV